MQCKILCDDPPKKYAKLKPKLLLKILKVLVSKTSIGPVEYNLANLKLNSCNVKCCLFVTKIVCKLPLKTLNVLCVKMAGVH